MFAADGYVSLIGRCRNQFSEVPKGSISDPTSVARRLGCARRVLWAVPPHADNAASIRACQLRRQGNQIYIASCRVRGNRNKQNEYREQPIPQHSDGTVARLIIRRCVCVWVGFCRSCWAQHYRRMDNRFFEAPLAQWLERWSYEP